jgi:hypothetical protein
VKLYEGGGSATDGEPEYRSRMLGSDTINITSEDSVVRQKFRGYQGLMWIRVNGL